MNTTCPQCSQNSLYPQLRISLTNDAFYDDNDIALFACDRCSCKVIGIFRESRRGALDSEVIDVVYRIIPDSLYTKLHDAIVSCPQPEKSHCECKAHQELGELDKSDNWIFPDSIEQYERFFIK